MHSRALSPRVAGFALSAAGSMLFAVKGVIIKFAYRYGIDAITLLALRMALSMPVFLLIGAIEWRGRSAATRPDARTLLLAGGIGVIGYYLSSMLDFEGLRTLDAQSERLILFTYPFFVILFARIFFGRPMRVHALLGAGLSYAGLAVMFAGEPSRLGAPMIHGALLVATAAISFALYQLWGREYIVRIGPTLFTAVAMSAAGLALLLHFAFTHPVSALAITPAAWVPVIILALFATVLPAFLMSAGTARIGAQGTAIVSTLSPLVTVAFAVSLLGEPFGWPEAAGTLFVLGGVGLFTLIEAREAESGTNNAAVAEAALPAETAPEGATIGPALIR